MTHALSQSNLDATSPDAAAEARQQAQAYDSLFANREITLDDGDTVSIPPHPDFRMLDDENMAAYEELLFEMESYDREPDIYIPEQRLKDSDGKETGAVVPADTIRGSLKMPFRRTVKGPDGEDVTELIKPPHSVKVVMAALGDETYKKLREGGRSAADVWRIWGSQGLEAKQRQGRPAADAGTVDLAPVPEADSQ